MVVGYSCPFLILEDATSVNITFIYIHPIAIVCIHTHTHTHTYATSLHVRSIAKLL